MTDFLTDMENATGEIRQVAAELGSWARAFTALGIDVMSERCRKEASVLRNIAKQIDDAVGRKITEDLRGTQESHDQIIRALVKNVYD